MKIISNKGGKELKLSFRKVLGVAFIIAALICIYFAFLQQEKYIQGNAEYKKIKQTATDTPSDDSKQDFQVDWNTLKTQNPDIVGWIRMDPSVNYPIVQTKNNSYYLKHGFGKSYNINGCIFMHADNKSDWSDPNTIVYGHNMINATVPYTIDMQTKEDFQSYLDTIKKLSTYQMNVPVTTDDHIVTLSTCTNHGRQRFLIQGVLTNIENNKE